MTTISISIDDETKAAIDLFTKEDAVTTSVFMRRLVKKAARERALNRAQALMMKKARELGVDGMSVDELEAYLG